jgi:hypothetical protein
VPGELAPPGSGRWWRLEEVTDVQLLALPLKRTQDDRRSSIPHTDLEQVPPEYRGALVSQ